MFCTYSLLLTFSNKPKPKEETTSRIPDEATCIGGVKHRGWACRRDFILWNAWDLRWILIYAYVLFNKCECTLWNWVLCGLFSWSARVLHYWRLFFSLHVTYELLVNCVEPLQKENQIAFKGTWASLSDPWDCFPCMHYWPFMGLIWRWACTSPGELEHRLGSGRTLCVLFIRHLIE